LGVMKALVWEGPFKMRIKEVEKPRPVKGKVLIRTKSVGICGSDSPERHPFKKSLLTEM